MIDLAADGRNRMAREKEYWDARVEFEWLTEESIAQIVASLPPIQGDVLEMCSGSGMFTQRLKGSYSRYVCLDLSASLLKQARITMPDKLIVAGDAENPAFSSAAFDMVLVFAGLHHLPDMEKSIRDAYRLLRPGGRFICFEPNAECWYRKPSLSIKRLLKIYTEDERFLYPDEVISPMEKTGFVSIETQYMTPEYHPKHLKTWFNRVLGSSMLAVATWSAAPRWQSFFLMTALKPEGAQP
ncbi:MAG: methyltransferase domain-containing protein [Anaerolineae bacterium]|nr:methyltransferase domain-containing protein [Anaerolineae bacterium]